MGRNKGAITNPMAKGQAPTARQVMIKIAQKIEKIITTVRPLKSFDEEFVGFSFIVHPTNFFAATLALCPPKPKELLMMALTFISRAVLGT